MSAAEPDKMGSTAFRCVDLDQFVFCDSSGEMIKIVQERFNGRNTQFLVCDIQELNYVDKFDVVTAIQVIHYLHMDEREAALKKCYQALKKNGLFIVFENFAPFTDLGTSICLEKWKRYQIKQGKSSEESERHIARYGKEYFPISLSENRELLLGCGFRAVEILWLSNMQVGLWGIK